AIARVQREIEKNPKKGELQLLLARIYDSKHETNKVESALLKAIELDPELQPAYVMLARLYMATKKNEKALQELSTAVAKKTNDVTALMLMGAIQDEAKDFTAARSTYEW